MLRKDQVVNISDEQLSRELNALRERRRLGEVRAGLARMVVTNAPTGKLPVCSVSVCGSFHLSGLSVTYRKILTLQCPGTQAVRMPWNYKQPVPSIRRKAGSPVYKAKRKLLAVQMFLQNSKNPLKNTMNTFHEVGSDHGLLH